MVYTAWYLKKEFSREVDERSKIIRRCIIEMANASASAHVGSSLSCVDVLNVLHFKVARFDPWEKRDICILSKGHAAMALYATLAARGFLDRGLLEGYFQNNGTLPAHLDRFTAKGIEVSAGALGHGFNVGLGIAFGFKQDAGDRRVFAVIGDGESQEGSIWEGAMFAPKLGLDNFTAIIDYNNLQGYGRASELCTFEPVAEKWRAFGWTVLEVDGHDVDELENALRAEHKGRPKVVIAHTVKGKGVSFMEDKLEWHYYIVTEELKKRALEELQ